MRLTLGAAGAVLLLALGAVFARAQTADVLVNGGFETGASGWAVSGPAPLTVDGTAPVHAGAAAAHLTAASLGTIDLRTRYWDVAAVPGAPYTLRAWLVDNSPDLSDIAVQIVFYDAQDRPIDTNGTASTAVLNDSAEYQLLTAGPVDAPADAANVAVRILGRVAAAGVTLHVDSVSLEQGVAPPPATASPTATATSIAPAAPTATASATATTTATATPTAPSTTTPTATARATATATQPAARTAGVYDTLVNGDFESPEELLGWGNTGGLLTLTDGAGTGQAAALISTSDSTKWLNQTVRVEAGGWYRATAYLRPDGGADAAWLRVAWYASADGAGTQLSVVDSNTVSGGAQTVRLEAAQAPPGARTARIRLMLRPLDSSSAVLVADDVTFARTAAPTPTPTPSPTATSTPRATATASATAGRTTATASPTVVPGSIAGLLRPSNPLAGAPQPAGAVSPSRTPSPTRTAARTATATEQDDDDEDQPRPASQAGRTTPRASATTAARAAQAESTARTSSTAPGRVAQTAASPAAPPPAAPVYAASGDISLRITEVLPNPSEPGNDADFEWVEVANVGTQPVSLAGMLLRDNRGDVPLPDLILQPGAVLVVAGPRATVPEASAYWPPGGLSNGLGNAGDRLALVAADGRIIDALSWGSDAAYDNPPLEAPAAGRSLRRYFADDGSLLAIEESAEPSPGLLETPPTSAANAGDDSAAGPSQAAAGGGSGLLAWMLLGAVGGSALLGAGGWRARALINARRES